MGFKDVLIKNLVSITLLLGIVLGMMIGALMIVINPNLYTKRVIMYVGFPGEIFKRILRAIALPLIASCIVYSVGNVYKHLLTRFGYQFMIFIIATKLESAILAACFGTLFRPGKTLAPSEEDSTIEDTGVLVTITDTILDSLRNMCPQNMLEVSLRHYKTRLVNTNNDSIDDIDQWKVIEEGQTINFQNVLGLTTVSVIVGITLNLIDEEGQYMLSLVKCILKATMVIAMWAMRFAPIGLAFIMLQEILVMEKSIHILTEMSAFLIVLFAVLTIQAGVVYPLTYLIIVRKNPFKLYWNISESLMLAFATGSSDAALPYAIYNMRDIGVDSRVVNFVMAIGTCVNKDGTSVWVVLGAIFIAELNNTPLYLGDLFTIIVHSVLASMSIAGIPNAAIMMLKILLITVGIPLKGFYLLMAVDWICARYRTMINLCGNAVTVCVLHQINRGVLEEFPETETPPEEEIK